jgi:hypothetical protein
MLWSAFYLLAAVENITLVTEPCVLPKILIAARLERWFDGNNGLIRR